jgi:hypothetical protein
MSQQLIPITGGVVPDVQTTPVEARLNVLSQQYIEVNKLEPRATEWIPGGRPIYRRLPATSETYQINFFNVVSESNLSSTTGIEKVGYVYVPWGQSINGPESLEVVASDNLQCLLIKSGTIVWEYGKTLIRPTIVDLGTLEVLSGKYQIGFQLIYDDSPILNQYRVEDFALTGQPFSISSSTDSVTGWRYPAVNAFLNTDGVFWKNSDTYYPPYAQPSDSFLQWQSEYTQAYSTLILRCPPNTAYTGSATLFYESDSNLSEVNTTSISIDSTGQFFQFDIEEPNLQTGWKVVFSDLEIAIQSITVSGLLTLGTPQASPSPRAGLVMYPFGTLPNTVTNANGEKIPATYCILAEVDVSNTSTLLDIVDTREIIHRDYVPVADWLTKPFDEDLINLYEQVSGYSQLWMSPSSCMGQEYENLKKDQITVEA